MECEEKCVSFGTRLEQKLHQVSLQYPNKISDGMYWNCVRERFFHGLSKNMRTNLRTQFDGGANYYKLLELARMIESENFNENSKIVKKSTNPKSRSKVGVVTVDNTAQQLEGAVKGLTKLLQGNQQNTQMQHIPQYVANPVQNNSNSLPQASQSQNPANPQGVRGGYRSRGGRGRGGLILCY